jgi:hypothetical protein
MTHILPEDVKVLAERLRAKKPVWEFDSINPDGPEAADALEAQSRAYVALAAELAVYRDKAETFGKACAEKDAQSIALAERVGVLEAELRRIAEGNLGDMPWQAGYERIKEVARAALTKDKAND